MLESQIITSYPDAALEKAWFEFLADSNYPSHYTSPGFFEMPYWADKNPFALIISHDSRIVAAVCGIFPDNEISIGLPVRPQVTFDPACGKDELAVAILDGLVSMGAEKLDLITLFSMEPVSGLSDLGFVELESVAGDRVVVLDLTLGAEALFNDLSSSRRANIRKAKRRKLIEVFELTEKSDLDELYPIHIEWCKMKGISPDSPDCFYEAWNRKDFVKIFGARSEGKIIAGSTFRFVKKGIVEYAGNVSTLESRKLRPNDLLMWTAIEWAADAGFERFSMGASHPFLQRFGGTMESSFRYRMDRSLFRRHDMADALRSVALRAYMSMPEGARARLKNMVGR